MDLEEGIPHHWRGGWVDASLTVDDLHFIFRLPNRPVGVPIGAVGRSNQTIGGRCLCGWWDEPSGRGHFSPVAGADYPAGVCCRLAGGSSLLAGDADRPARVVRLPVAGVNRVVAATTGWLEGASVWLGPESVWVTA